MPSKSGIYGVARRPGGFADEHALFAKDAIDERRFPHVRPPHDGDPRFRRFGLLLLRFCRKPPDDFIEQVAHAQSVLGRDFHDGLESQLIEIERTRARASIVRLVDRDDDGPAGRAHRVRNFVIGRHQPFTPIDDEHEHVGVRDGFASVVVDDLLQRVFALPEHPGRIGEQERNGAPVRGLLDHVAGRAGRRGDDRAALARNTVKKCRFPDIRSTDQERRRGAVWTP